MTPIITTLNNSGARGRVRAPAASGGVTPDWEIFRDFNSGTVGTSSSGQADGFDSGASQSLYTTTQVYEGAQACRVLCPEGTTGNGSFGGVITLPTVCQKGDSLWTDAYVYWPDTLDITDMRAKSKFLRVQTRADDGSTNKGYNDLFLSTGSRSAFLFQAIKEVQFVWFTGGSWDDDFTFNAWHRVSQHIQYDNVTTDSGGTGRLRVWYDNVLKIDATAYQSLDAATDEAFRFLAYTYYDPPTPANVLLYMDAIRLAKNGVPTWALDLEGVS